MLSPFQAHSNALADLFLSLGDACPKLGWNGSEFRCIPSAALQASANGEGGFSPDSDCSASLLFEDFVETFPTSTEVITYPAGADEYKIVSVIAMAGQKVFRLKLQSSNQGL
jgi:hypothetical protein